MNRSQLRVVNSSGANEADLEKEKHTTTVAHGGDGGGGPMDDLIRRVTNLEDGHKLIISKLDAISNDIADSRIENEKRFGAIEGRLTGIDAKLDAKATKADLTPIETKLTGVKDAVDTRAAISDLNLLKGKVESLPTTLQLILFAVAVFTAAGISRWFLH